jgi:hypothetical protein
LKEHQQMNGIVTPAACPVHHSRLVAVAHGILMSDLKSHGTTVSDLHSAALLQLLETYADYIDGNASGRKAFGLPTGMGKTSSVVALIGRRAPHPRP